MEQALTSQFQVAFLFRLGIDLICMFVLVRLIYYRAHRKTEFLLTFFALNLLIFFIAYVLNRVEIGLGAAFGLFAVFSMLRYRTEGISTTDMTYLFTGIAIGLITAVSEPNWIELTLFAAIILVMIQLLESGLIVKREIGQQILYDRIHLVHARDREALIQDLRQRTGLNVKRVEVREIDLLRDAATLMVYYPADASTAPQPELVER